MLSRPSSCLLLALIAASPAVATQKRSDFQIWPVAGITVPVSEHVETTTDVLLGFTDGASRAGGQLLLRAIVSYRLSERLSVGGGYTYIRMDDGIGARFKEHRTVQDALFRSSTERSRPVFILRSRLEERLREGERGTALRLRLLTRINFPLTGDGPGVVAWNEMFCAIDQRSWSGRRGLAFTLSFLGLSIPLSENVKVEPGYLNQTYLARGDDRVRHVLAVFLTARL